MKILPLLLLASGSVAHADLFVTNFTGINGTTSATGTWRNETTATDLPAFPVTLSQSGGSIKPADGSSTQSIINPTGTDPYNLWQDVPAVPGFTPGIDVFEPNFIGDYINIETQENAPPTEITIDLGALITNPVISFTDVEYRTVITFPGPLTVLASTSNLQVVGSTVSSDGTVAAGDPPPPLPSIFGQESAGSVQLTGTFSQIELEVAVGTGNATVGPNDRTGYVVSTMTPPQPLVAGPAPELSISRSGNQITLTWDLGDFDSIEMSGTGLSGWTPIPGLDPGAVSTWSGAISTLGDHRFFRGVYTP